MAKIKEKKPNKYTRAKSTGTGGAAGVGIESVGGGTGEVLGRLAADQEMDINEILNIAPYSLAKKEKAEIHRNFLKGNFLD